MVSRKHVKFAGLAFEVTYQKTQSGNEVEQACTVTFDFRKTSTLGLFALGVLHGLFGSSVAAQQVKINFGENAIFGPSLRFSH